MKNFWCLFPLALFSWHAAAQSGSQHFWRSLDPLPVHEQLTRVTKALASDSLAKDTLYAPMLLHYRHVAMAEERWCSAFHITHVLANFNIYSSLDHGEAFRLCHELAGRLDACDDVQIKAWFYIDYAEAATYMQRVEESLTILDEAIAFFEHIGDSSMHEMGYAYLKAAENTAKLSKFNRSVVYYKKARGLFQHQKDTALLLWTHNGLSTLLSANGLYEEAQKERQIIFELGPRKGKYSVVAMAHIGSGMEAFMQNNHEKELYHFRTAVHQVRGSSGIRGIVRLLALSVAAEAYARQHMVDTARLYMSWLKPQMNDHINNQLLKTYYDFARSYLALEEGKLEEAEAIVTLLMPSIRASKTASVLYRVHVLLAAICEKKNDFRQALHHIKIYTHVHDSVKDAAARNQLIYLRTQFEVEKKDFEIEKQQRENMLLSAKNEGLKQWVFFGGGGLIVTFVIVLLTRSEAAARRQQRLQTRFSHDLIRSQENERTRIARELHDGVGQSLILLKNQASQRREDATASMVAQALEEVRTVSKALHPAVLDQAGLTAGIRRLVLEADKATNTFFTEEIDMIDNLFSKDHELQIYRIIQESLNNLIKYAQSEAALVQIKNCDGRITILVRDYGVGFDTTGDGVAGNGLGMKTLKERAHMLKGKLTIESAKGQGTCVMLELISPAPDRSDAAKENDAPG